MRVGGFLMGTAWVHAAAAAPGMIVGARAKVYEAPSETAVVVSAFGRGATICVVDHASDSGALHSSPGWLPVRLPGRDHVGYVRSESVDLVAVSAAAARLCDRAATTPPTEIEPLPSVDWLVPRHPVRISLALGSGAAWFRKAAAAQHHFGDSGPTFNVGVGLTIYDMLSVSSSFGAAFPGDHASFTQDVVPLGGGDSTSAESQLEVLNLSIAVGLRTPFIALGARGRGTPWVAAFGDYGSSKIQAYRSISNCSDCRTEDLEMPNGTFWRVGLDLAPAFRWSKGGWSFTAAYQRYGASAGFVDEIRIGFTTWLL
jgi:hypothetical protein